MSEPDAFRRQGHQTKLTISTRFRVGQGQLLTDLGVGDGKHPFLTLPGVCAGPEQLDHVGVVQVPHEAVLCDQVGEVRGGGGAGPKHLDSNLWTLLSLSSSSSWSL